MRDLDGNVLALTVFEDQSGPALYAGGSFENAGSVRVNGVAMWDGIAWSPLAGPAGAGVLGWVHALASFDDGSGPALYAGGSFTIAGGIVVNRIAKWDGHEWSALPGPSGIGLDGPVYAMTVFDDGSGPALYVGGSFTSAGGVTVNRIAKWNGSEWSTLVTPSGTGVNSTVEALAVFDGGNGPGLYVGGSFFQAGGIPVNRIARWDGEAWSALAGPSGTGVDSSVKALATFDDGSGPALYVGGSFRNAGGVGVDRIAKWNGALWTALTGPSGTGLNNTVYALAVHDDGSGAELYVGGWFTRAGSLTANRIAKWDGSAWSALLGPSGNGVDETVRTLASFDAGDGPALYAGGNFGAAGGLAVSHIARWTGAEWSTLASQSGAGVAGGGVHGLTSFDYEDGPLLLAGGGFASAGDAVANSVARWNGSEWSAFAGTSGTGVNGIVEAVAVFDDGSGAGVYAAGFFTAAGGVAANGIAKWDGEGWSVVGLLGPDQNEFHALTVFDDGSGGALYAAGWFVGAGGHLVNHIAKWDGSTWSPLAGPSGTGVTNAVFALTTYDDGNGEALYVGGGFDQAGGIPVNGIARWDGSTWSALAGPSGTGVSGGVRALAVFDDGSGPALYVGGSFTMAGGVVVNGIAKWDGATWSALTGPNGTGVAGDVRALTVFDDGSGAALYAGGIFTTAGGVAVNGIAEWDGSSWSALAGPWEVGVDAFVYALTEFDDGGGTALYAGGVFNLAGGLASSSIGKYSCGPPDTAAPTDPAIQATSPPVDVWSIDLSVEVTFAGASDEPGGSGVAGYSVLFDQNATSAPDGSIDLQHTTDPHVVTSAPLSDGDGWYFHLSTCDYAGNCSSAIHAGPFRIDTAPPSAPGPVTSPSHDGGPSNDPTIEIEWTAASDPLSGVAGYRYDFSEAPTAPECSLLASTSAATSATSAALADGTWYAHICAVDHAGNLGGVTSGGPYEIDTTAPSAPGPVASTSHDGGPSNDSTIDIEWTAATDPFSGVAGYRYEFAETPTVSDCASLSSSTTSTSATSAALADGTWYAHVCAVDNAGNLGGVTSGGPYEIDTEAAAVESVGSVPDSGDGVLVAGEELLGGTTRLLVRWSDAMADPAGDSDPEDVTNPANYRLVGAGQDGAIGTPACAPVAGDDVEWPFTAAEYDTLNQSSALRFGGSLALPAELYRFATCGTLEDDAGNPVAVSSIDFRILGSDQLAQPNLDQDLAGWSVTEPIPGSLQWSPDDAGGEASSGSAEIVTANGAGATWSLSQCVAVDAPRWLGRLRTRVTTSTPDQPEVSVRAEWFSGAACDGVSLGAAAAPPVTGDTADEWLESVHDGGVPPGAASARVAAVVMGGTASSFTVAVDDLFHGNPFTIFVDGFETATTERWSATVPLAPKG